MAPSPARILGISTAIVALLAFAALMAWKTAPRPAPSEALHSASSLPRRKASSPPSEQAPLIAPSSEPGMTPASKIPTRCPPEAPLSIRAIKLPQSPEELFRIAKEKPESLGPASIGSPTRGSLFGGMELKDSEGILHSGGYAFGTELVIQSIERAVREVRRCHPNTPRLYVGDISRDRGGWLRPHRSHQSGLDADIGYYYKGPATWYLAATAQNLDVERTWTLIRALLEGGHVEMIFMDLSIQGLLQKHIATLPREEQPVGELFQSPTKKDTIIRHTWGHATHFHVRYVDKKAIELGEKLGPMMPRLRAARKAGKGVRAGTPVSR